MRELFEAYIQKMNTALQTTKSVTKKMFPGFILRKLKSRFSKFKKDREIVNTRNAFELANESPAWLDREHWHLLQARYPSWSDRGKEYQRKKELLIFERRNAENLLSLIPHEQLDGINNFLDLGCGAGMTSYFLQTMGKATTAIDIPEREKYKYSFDERAVNEGVTFLEMDAASLQFEDESFDFVFSYHLLDHISDPESVMREAIRVVKPGGYIYHEFGQYMSPWGYKHMQFINFPYCQLLFPKELIVEMTGERGVRHVKWVEKTLNRLSLQEFRELLSCYSDSLERCKYHEKYDTNYLDLIRQYPSVFRSKTKSFDSLICNKIEVLFKKKHKNNDDQT